MKSWKIYIALFVLSPFAAWSQGFTEVTSSVGVENSVSAISEYGNGICVHDWNDDGWDDFALAAEGTPPQFFQNDGTGNFIEVEFGITNAGVVKSILMADLDNDGDSDIILNRYLGNVSVFENTGELQFSDISQLSGIEGNGAEGMGINLGDYNRDGLLDLYVSNYNFEDELITNKLYRNEGGITFTEVSNGLGASNDFQPTFQTVFFDQDRDGWQDLFVANDRTVADNAFYSFNGSDFDDLSSEYNMDPNICSMCANVGDFDNDSDLDIYVTNTSAGNLLNQNEGNIFLEVAEDWQCQVNRFCWGSLWIDYDNNLWKDLLVCTMPSQGQGVSGENFFYVNTDSEFEYLETSGFENTSGETYSTAMGDFNNDGFMDVITYSGAPENVQLYYNNGVGGNYIKVDLTGTVSNIEGIGSFIEVWAGDDYAMEYTLCGESYMAQFSEYEILGLGDHETIDSLKVSWLSGIVDCYYNVPVNQTLNLLEGETITAMLTASSLFLCPEDSIEISVGGFDSYSWSTGDTTATIYASQAGNFFCEVVTAEGLQIMSDTLEIVALPSLEYSVELNHPMCMGDSSGSAIITVESGVQLDSVIWSMGDTGLVGQDLQGGFVSFTAYDENQCAYTQKLILIGPPELLFSVEVESHVSCFGLSDGVVNPIVSGGTEPYDIQWDGLDPNNMSAGVYEIELLDENDCSVVATFSVLEPELLAGDVITEGGGIATLEIEGGTPPYEVEWSNGALDSLMVSGLAEGDFWVSVTDSAGCEIIIDFTITSIWEQLDQHFYLFPNPAQQDINLELFPWQSSSIVILNALGQPIQSLTPDSRFSQVNISHWPKGIYIIQVHSPEVLFTTRFIKR